jgi:hypothetical protein
LAENIEAPNDELRAQEEEAARLEAQRILDASSKAKAREARLQEAARILEEAQAEEKRNAEIDQYLLETKEEERKKSDDLKAAYAFLGVTMGKEEFPLEEEVSAVREAIRRSLVRNHPDRQYNDHSKLELTRAHYNVIRASTRMEFVNPKLKSYVNFGRAVEAVNVDTLRRGEYAAAKVVLPRGFV